MKISRHTLAQLIVTVAQMVIGTVPAHADRMAITPAQMTEALTTSGLRVTMSQIQTLSQMTATQSNPKLNTTKVESLDANTTKVRLQCERTDVCLPFYVLIHWPETGQAQRALEKASAQPHLLL